MKFSATLYPRVYVYYTLYTVYQEVYKCKCKSIKSYITLNIEQELWRVVTWPLSKYIFTNMHILFHIKIKSFTFSGGQCGRLRHNRGMSNLGGVHLSRHIQWCPISVIFSWISSPTTGSISWFWGCINFWPSVSDPKNHRHWSWNPECWHCSHNYHIVVSIWGEFCFTCFSLLATFSDRL